MAKEQEGLTDRQIVEGAEELAGKFAGLQGYKLDAGCSYHASSHPKAYLCWVMAVEAYEHISHTDVLNAVAEVDG